MKNRLAILAGAAALLLCIGAGAHTPEHRVRTHGGASTSPSTPGTSIRSIHQLVQIAEYYQYLASDAPPFKQMASWPDLDRRAEAMADYILALNGNPGRYQGQMQLDNELFLRYMPEDTKGGLFRKLPDSARRQGAADVMAGRYRTDEALVMLEAYRRLLIANADPAKLTHQASMLMGDGGQQMAIRSCNIAWLSWAVTQPVGAESLCPQDVDPRIQKIINDLSPTYSDEAFPISNRLAAALDSFSAFISTFNYSYDIPDAVTERDQRKDLLNAVATALDRQNALIGRLGGVNAWQQMSAKLDQIQSLRRQKQKEGSLEDMRRLQGEIEQLCSDIHERYPSAQVDAACD